MQPAARASRSVVQSLYGIRIRTPWPVDGVAVTDETWDVEFVAGDSDLLMNAASYVPAEQASSGPDGRCPTARAIDAGRTCSSFS